MLMSILGGFIGLVVGMVAMLLLIVLLSALSEYTPIDIGPGISHKISPLLALIGLFVGYIVGSKGWGAIWDLDFSLEQSWWSIAGSIMIILFAASALLMVIVVIFDKFSKE